MRFVHDPLQPQLSTWRLKQNIVLLIFLNAWWSAPELRTKMTYTLATKDGKKVLLDPEGLVACEFESVGNTFCVHWYRSFTDYEEIDYIGQVFTPRVEVASGGSKAS